MRRTLFLCLIIAAAYATGSPVELLSKATVSPAAASPEEYRLNSNVWPKHYDIQLTPYFQDEGNNKAFTFDGVATILIETSEANVMEITLHKRHVDIKSHFLQEAANSAPVDLDQEVFTEETDILRIPLRTPLKPNVEYRLIFNYIGLMEDDMHGFYKSYYKVNGEKVWMASTQFQQTEARRAFPCFDEPKFKATFQLVINTPATYNAFSNTEIEKKEPVGERSMITFKKTPSMSTYLLAFIVARYQTNQRNGVGILARPEAQNQTEYSLETGIAVLDKLDAFMDYKFTDVPEMERLYMAAIPDFSAGAMENWGLLTYRETNILYRSDDSTSMQQQRIAAVITHEMAHLWFGDLVTCDWWDVTWLNEGFARYFQYFGTAMVETEWDLEQQFVVEQLQGVMQLDSLESTHPMTHYVYTQAAISGIFDNISYNKGAVTLRMVEHFITHEKFRQSLREYLKERAYKTTRPENLFQSFNTHGKQTTEAFIKPWTEQAGYPLVTVSKTAEGFKITQKRFLVNNMDHNDQTTWPLPITYATKAEDFTDTMPTIITENPYTIRDENADSHPYFILNNQQVGYYRVNYDADNWAKISAALRSDNFGGIHVLNRAQIVDDLFNLARAGVVEYVTALEILLYLRTETQYAPWLAAVNGLNFLTRRIHPNEEEVFAEYVMDMFENVYNLVEFKSPSQDERRTTTYMRINALQWMCNYGHEGCKSAALEEFKRFYENPSQKVHPDLRQVVYCEGIRQGTMEHFDFLWNQYMTTNMATEQILILQGLGCAASRDTIFKMMDAISSDDIRMQDKSGAFSYLLSNTYTLKYMAEYLRTYYLRWSTAHGSLMNVASAFNNILARLKSDEEVSEIRSFMDRNLIVFGQEVHESVVGGIKEYDRNKEFMMQYGESISTFFSTKYRSSASIATLSFSIVLGVVISLIL